jgi:hypothetical protein
MNPQRRGPGSETGAKKFSAFFARGLFSPFDDFFVSEAQFFDRPEKCQNAQADERPARADRLRCDNKADKLVLRLM